MSKKRVAIIDYGVGNIRSVSRVIESTSLEDNSSIEVVLTRDTSLILDSDLIVLPGVGSFNSASEQLFSFADELVSHINSGTPTVGICLGMQLLFEKSEEGSGDGLGVFKGSVTKLSSNRKPHMGWNKIQSTEKSNSQVPWAYFAHSYACRPDDEEIVVGWSTYDGDRFPAIVRKQNILGTQFHPEKSDLAGVRLLHNFISEVIQ